MKSYQVLTVLCGGIILGASLQSYLSKPKDLWSLCQASPSVVWKSGSLEVRQNANEHPYSCVMYLDGQGNVLPVKVYKDGKLAAARLPVEALRDPILSNAELAAEMSSL